MSRTTLVLALLALQVLWPAMQAEAEDTKNRDTATEESKAMQSIVEGTHLRIARPTDDLGPVTAFYREGLGFDVIGSFEDHEGFDGVMLGHRGAGYHIELTRQRGHTVGRAPNKEHLLVFYMKTTESWQAAIDHMKSLGYQPVESNNPYWEKRGKTFEDPDGYRVVFQNTASD